MNRKKIAGICMALCLVGLTGCGSKSLDSEENAIQIYENSEKQGSEEDSINSVGQGFRPPKGSHIDKNGNVVDKEGNTYDKDGGWQVPEGGQVAPNGQILDKDGNVMGGGAKIGSKG